MTKSYIVSLPPTTILEFFPAIVGTVVSKCAFFLILTNMVLIIEDKLTLVHIQIENSMLCDIIYIEKYKERSTEKKSIIHTKP